MPQLQEVFNRLKESQKKQKEIKAAYRDSLKSSQAYQQLLEEYQALKEKKKKMEEGIRLDFASEFRELDDIKLDIKTDQEVLSDMAMTKLMQGQTVEITDEYENRYEPVFSVKFKKAN